MCWDCDSSWELPLAVALWMGSGRWAWPETALNMRCECKFGRCVIIMGAAGDNCPLNAPLYGECVRERERQRVYVCVPHNLNCYQSWKICWQNFSLRPMKKLVKLRMRTRTRMWMWMRLPAWSEIIHGVNFSCMFNCPVLSLRERAPPMTI